jgi:hypothetical protein
VKRSKHHEHFVSSTSVYVEPDESLQKDNYDPYRTAITTDPDPKEVTKKGSLWITLRHLLFGW